MNKVQIHLLFDLGVCVCVSLELLLHTRRFVNPVHGPQVDVKGGLVLVQPVANVAGVGIHRLLLRVLDNEMAFGIAKCGEGLVAEDALPGAAGRDHDALQLGVVKATSLLKKVCQRRIVCVATSGRHFEGGPRRRVKNNKTI